MITLGTIRQAAGSFGQQQATGPGGPASNTALPPPNAYFTDQKKGEVNELKQLLRTVSVERDTKKLRDVIKKVIAYMTLGVDVSRLFTEMMLAIEARDRVVKKMVYLYLCTYAHSNPELAIMCVNTLQRDCGNEDPMVRGLALRSLCSLRLPSIVEYISEPLRRGLMDGNSYVRKTAAMGVLKLHHLAPGMVQEIGLADTLYAMVQSDPDGQVVTNCLLVLGEMLVGEGGMTMNRSVVLSLLGRLDSFNEWGLCAVLGLVCQYKPTDDAEIFSIMNLLDPVLRTTNSGVVLAVVNCFIYLTDSMPQLTDQVYMRIKAPLLTLMAGGSPEVMHAILSHVELLAQKRPGIFDDEYRLFYTRFNEPTYVKYAKIKMLSLLANPQNVTDIYAELSEYVSDADNELARRAIRGIGLICHRLPSSCMAGLGQLVEFLDVDASYARSEAVLALQSILRKYPELKDHVLPRLHRCLKRVDESSGRAAVIWMVGEFGSGLVEAPYMLEPIIDAYTEETSTEVKLQLLTATMKLFFMRPPEVQSMLGRLLAAAAEDVSSQDLHDRALLYYRLLRHDVAAAADVIAPPATSSVHDFAEEKDTALRDAIFKEFNTLSVVYGETSDWFTASAYRIKPHTAPTLLMSPEDRLQQEFVDMGLQLPITPQPQAHIEPIQPSIQYNTAPAPQIIPSSNVDLLGLGFTGGDDSSIQPGMEEVTSPSWVVGGGVTEITHAHTASHTHTDAAVVELTSEAQMTSAEFQSLWGRLGESGPSVFEGEGVVTDVPSSTAAVEGAVESTKLRTLASGDKADTMRFFFFGQSADKRDAYLVQCLIQKATHRVSITVKNTAFESVPTGGQIIANLVMRALGASAV